MQLLHPPLHEAHSAHLRRGSATVARRGPGLVLVYSRRSPRPSLWSLSPRLIMGMAQPRSQFRAAPAAGTGYAAALCLFPDSIVRPVRTSLREKLSGLDSEKAFLIVEINRPKASQEKTGWTPAKRGFRLYPLDERISC